MKKRLKRKLKNKEKDMRYICDDCGHKTKEKDVLIHHDKNLGDFIININHYKCPCCGLVLVSIDMLDILSKMKEERRKELLLKNYPPESNEYISEDEMCKLENCTKEELKNKYINDLVYNLEINGNHLYLKKSYELYKEKNRPGWFDITYHHK